MKLDPNAPVKVSDLLGRFILPYGERAGTARHQSGEQMVEGMVQSPFEQISRAACLGGLKPERAAIYQRYYSEQRQRLDISATVALASTLALIGQEAEYIELGRTCALCHEVISPGIPCRCERSRAALVQDIRDARAGLPERQSPARPYRPLRRLLGILWHDLSHFGPITIGALLVLGMLLMGYLAQRGADTPMQFFFGGD